MPLSTATFDWVRTVVRSDAAIVLEPGKEYLVESRLAPLARTAGKPDVNAYVDQIRSSADRRSRDQIVDALTTNETSWFRDGGPFTAFAGDLLPALKAARASTRSIRIWSAACSTGQEPYSIAMMLAEATGMDGWRNQIMATDYSPTVLAQAQKGVYSQVEMNRGLPAAKLVTHFKRQGMHWQVGEELRRLITFKQMNLAQPFPNLGQFDVVFLRNVLIYFDLPTRREILQRVRSVCRPDGYLILGGAETTLGVDEKWERVVLGRVSVYRPRP